jgi:hypothetical protein
MATNANKVVVEDKNVISQLIDKIFKDDRSIYFDNQTGKDLQVYFTSTVDGHKSFVMIGESTIIPLSSSTLLSVRSYNEDGTGDWYCVDKLITLGQKVKINP